MNNKGYSLIEVMMALVILLIGILGVAGMQMSAINHNAHANKASMAMQAASSQMEILINTPGAVSSVNGIDTESYPGFVITWKVEPYNDDAERIVVTVSFRSMGRPTTRALSYIRALDLYKEEEDSP